MQALAGLWVAGRVLVATGPAVPAIVVDCLFLPCVALAIGIPVARARNWRNLPVAAVPALLGGANLLFHLDHADLIALARANGGALLALDLFALLVTLMAGRVIPAFTGNAVPTAKPRRNPYVEAVAFGTLGVLLVAGPLDPWLPDGPWLAGVAAAGALAHLVRLWLWDPAATRCASRCSGCCRSPTPGCRRRWSCARSGWPTPACRRLRPSMRWARAPWAGSCWA